MVGTRAGMIWLWVVWSLLDRGLWHAKANSLRNCAHLMHVYAHVDTRQSTACACLGMLPTRPLTSPPLPPFHPLQFKLVFDAVYTPRDTQLLKDAAAAGCTIVDGVAMFVGQAVEQFRLFTGVQEPPVDVMEAALLGKE